MTKKQIERTDTILSSETFFNRKSILTKGTKEIRIETGGPYNSQVHPEFRSNVYESMDMDKKGFISISNGRQMVVSPGDRITIQATVTYNGFYKLDSTEKMNIEFDKCHELSVTAAIAHLEKTNTHKIDSIWADITFSPIKEETIKYDF